MPRMRERLRIHLLSVAVAVTASVVAAPSGANAQTATADQPGKPLSLTQTPAASGQAGAVRKTRTRRVASRRHSKSAAQDTEQHADQPDALSADPAQSNASADAWLAASAPPANSPPLSHSAQVVAAQMAATDPARPDNASSPSTVVVGGQTVTIAASGQVNELDLAADSATIASAPPRGDRGELAAALTAKAAQVKDPQAAFVAADPNANDGSAGAQNLNAPSLNAQDAGAEETISQDTEDQNAAVQSLSPVGSASWIAQVVAALGGAMAAATVAWFLIGAGPQVRDYG